jgi:hypothetical protein
MRRERKRKRKEIRNLTSQLQQVYIYIINQMFLKDFEFNQAFSEEFYILTYCIRKN